MIHTIFSCNKHIKLNTNEYKSFKNNQHWNSVGLVCLISWMHRIQCYNRQQSALDSSCDNQCVLPVAIGYYFLSWQETRAKSKQIEYCIKYNLSNRWHRIVFLHSKSLYLLDILCRVLTICVLHLYRTQKNGRLATSNRCAKIQPVRIIKCINQCIVNKPLIIPRALITNIPTIGNRRTIHIVYQYNTLHWLAAIYRLSAHKKGCPFGTAFFISNYENIILWESKSTSFSSSSL